VTKEEASMWLDWSEIWFKQDKNPLHVWRAIDWCLNSQPPQPIPDWCLPYLAGAATNITRLMAGQDIGEDRQAVTPSQALDRSREALGFSRQGKKNAFAEIIEMSVLHRHALDAERGHDAVKAIEGERSVSTDRAKRLLEKGRKIGRLR
jgi:hypothetical protein